MTKENKLYISQILINHIDKPMGFLFDKLRIDFKIESQNDYDIEKQLIIYKDKINFPIYQTKKENKKEQFYELSLDLEPMTRYIIELIIYNTNGEKITGKSWFETGKLSEEMNGNWIGNSDKNLQNTLFKKEFNITKKVKSARLYMTALGLYESYLNNKKIGDEILAPGLTDYDNIVQLQTYDITSLLQEKEKNSLIISVADGWYKGNFGFDGGADSIFGDHQLAIAEIHIWYQDESDEILITDDSWETTSGQISHSSIYYGEDLDLTKDIGNWKKVKLSNHKKNIITDRLSLPIKIKDKIPVKTIIKTPLGETVLDFGQNQAGWLEFFNKLEYGEKIKFEFGEILQNGNFYRDNLRAARAAFEVTSDGIEKWVSPHFTYFGYRYVKITGNFSKFSKEDFIANVIFSDIRENIYIKTNNKKVNQLISNVMWGQKSNFIDVPTDCPQRDERLGWTGDANIFSNTAMFNMDVYAFYNKWLRDIRNEQIKFNGMVPLYVPSMKSTDKGAAVWGDAITFIPWNIYNFYGDLSILESNYDSMKSWVNWIGKQTIHKNLWKGSFQFGDWLALDTETPGSPIGKTDGDFIASIYYYYSAYIIKESAVLLEKKDDVKVYESLSESILKEIRSEWVTPNGKLSLDTQTALSLSLKFPILVQQHKDRNVKELVKRIELDNKHLKTGFVGTPYLCQVLSDNNQHALAVDLFLNEDFPSWLYAVNLGATTVWERWNSVEPDGKINPEGMNSLNHYSIGAIMEWFYKYVLGINSFSPGFQRVTISPNFDYRLNSIDGSMDTPIGKLKISYKVEVNDLHKIEINISCPFGMIIDLNLPRTNKSTPISINKEVVYTDNKSIMLKTGEYKISYIPTLEYIEYYKVDTKVNEIIKNKDLVKKIGKIDSVLNFFKDNPDEVNGFLGTMSIEELSERMPFINVPSKNMIKINDLLKNTRIISN